MEPTASAFRIPMSRLNMGFASISPEDIPNRLQRCNDPKLPIGNIDRHIMPDGSACLGVYADIMIRWIMKPDIVNFLEDFAAPFLVGRPTTMPAKSRLPGANGLILRTASYGVLRDALNFLRFN